jgi:hypothetical protein
MPGGLACRSPYAETSTDVLNGDQLVQVGNSQHVAYEGPKRIP